MISYVNLIVNNANYYLRNVMERIQTLSRPLNHIAVRVLEATFIQLIYWLMNRCLVLCNILSGIK